MKPLLLVLTSLSEFHQTQVAREFELAYVPDAAQRGALITQRGAAIRVVLTIGTVGLTAGEMAAMPQLELVCALGVGYEKIDVEHARSRGVALANGAGTNDDCVADHAMGLLIAVVRQIPAFDSACRNGVWRDALPMLPQLAHKRMGILGLGTIGAKIMMPFSPFLTERSNWRQAWNPATRVAVGRCAWISSTFPQLYRWNRPVAAR